MKSLKQISYTLLTFIIMSSSFQCATSQKLEKEAPTDFQDVYYQNWVAGVRGGGSGTNLFINVKDVTVVLDSVYFKGKVAKLQNEKTNKTLFIARFNSSRNSQKDVIMSMDPNDEISNTVEIETPKIPFELKANECVVSYKKANKTHYYKISDIREKVNAHYPSVRPNR